MSDRISFPLSAVQSDDDGPTVALVSTGRTYSLGPLDTSRVSDGYHTFHELYEHRTVLFALVTALSAQRTWRSKQHEDGTMFDGMFIVGMNTVDGPITYHVDNGYWDMFYHCETLEYAPPFDGHTPGDVVLRLAAQIGMIQSIISMVRESQKPDTNRPATRAIENVDNFPSSGV
jgi:hypothetical protein